jgi:beta-fructofuranosidase
MKKFIIVLVGCVFTILLSACSKDSKKPELNEKGSIEQGDVSLFPKPKNGFVGDPMPYYVDGTMYLFYLYDGNYGRIGFHPWSLMTTTDFVNWEDHGEVIPYVDSISSQDLALGTGSVIKGKDGLFHAYYTGFNGTGEMPYFEKIQHATSTDMVNWTKHPEDGFYGGHNDFRDPYVLYSEEEDNYWMLITGRDKGKGVIRIYKSDDLYAWSDEGVFFVNDDGSYNLECPTLIKYGDYWYLSYSEQGDGNERVVHYRYTDDLSKGFKKPDRDYFDGWGFYAGRMEKVEDRLMLFGWVGTKELELDAGNYLWGGNLVVHELIQDQQGNLTPKIVTEVDQLLVNQVNYEVSDTNTTIDNQTYQFLGNKGYEYVLFEELLEKPTKTNFKVDLSQASNFGITLNAYDEIFGDLNVYFNVTESKLEFYNVAANQIKSSKPEISIDYTFDQANEVEVTLVTEGSVFVVYLNDEIALTSRAFNMADSKFGFFTLASEANVKQVKFYE